MYLFRLFARAPGGVKVLCEMFLVCVQYFFLCRESITAVLIICDWFPYIISPCHNSLLLLLEVCIQSLPICSPVFSSSSYSTAWNVIVSPCFMWTIIFLYSISAAAAMISFASQNPSSWLSFRSARVLLALSVELYFGCNSNSFSKLLPNIQMFCLM